MIEAILIVEHARRLVAGIVTSEETLGLAALGPLDREVPVAVLEAFVAFGLVIAAVAIARRSRLALVYVAVVQALIVVEVVARIIVGLAPLSTIGLSTLALGIAAVLASRGTRQWCDEPILLRH